MSGSDDPSGGGATVFVFHRINKGRVKTSSACYQPGTARPTASCIALRKRTHRTQGTLDCQSKLHNTCSYLKGVGQNNRRRTMLHLDTPEVLLFSVGRPYDRRMLANRSDQGATRGLFRGVVRGASRNTFLSARDNETENMLKISIPASTPTPGWHFIHPASRL